MLGPIMESVKGQVNYSKLDVDVEQDLAVKYKVRSVPTLVLIENGVEKNRLVGVHQSPEILKFYNS
jgi:thioredoxin 1